MGVSKVPCDYRMSWNPLDFARTVDTPALTEIPTDTLEFQLFTFIFVAGRKREILSMSKFIVRIEFVNTQNKEYFAML